MTGLRRSKAPGATGKAGVGKALPVREANEYLVLATLHAQTLAEASRQAAAQVRETNEHLVVATVQAQVMVELAEQATAQLAYQAKVEARMVQAQKLESLGLLSSGVAHDFNNLITTIIGYTGLGRLAVAPGSDLASYLEAIERSALKAGELTRPLQAYAGQGQRQIAEVDLGIVVKEISHLLTVSLPGHVSLRLDLADRVPFVKGDPTQIFQIVMNLITNAAEACPAGIEGRITLRTCGQEIDQASLEAGDWVLPMTLGRYATLEVADNGAGMTAKTLARIFEPFFTTKQTGHGLGLAAVIGILRGHGGGLRVVSQPGHGSCFTLFLPAMAEPRSLADLEPLPIWRGHGKLLIVEPEPAVRRQARHLTEQLGLTVLEARDGPEALACFRSHHKEVALVILARELPSLGGAEAFRALRAIDGRVPVILSSGYRQPDAGLALDGLAGCLKTPFRAAEFQGLLRRTLATPVGPFRAADPAGAPLVP